MAVVYHQPNPGEFRHSLFGCCDNCSDCLCAYFCPNCYSYCASQDAGEGTLMSCIHCFLFPCTLCCLRNAVRGKRGIEGGCCKDFCISYLCPCCAIIQIRREFND
ncbi:placenta-specific protein 8 [Brachionus plicatilis]|uniref:Placenta-specific protein 8 n=1 Tax=Brachionus plicatilis TaxID=10195 RepID=A0A3M7Q936_BRAPC|nr:placenta-specific protein 8 [Brachionus plicatilis]